MNARLPAAVLVMGPTAAGKTDLAVELSRRFRMDIISVDSAQVYRGMDIGTAKPGPEVLAKAPHRLIDIRDPAEPYSASEFRVDALREMNAITTAGRIPLLVGGTMLYFRSLLEGLSDLPAADAEVRRKIDATAQEAGWAAMHDRLRGIDPQAASRIDPNDPQRIQRALEVFELTGRPLSELQGRRMKRPLDYRTLKLVVCPSDRAELHRRIERRFDAMLEQGFEREVRELHARGDLHPDLPALRTVGYRQVWAWLEHECDRDTMREKALAATRQLAKRQLTWLRREEGALWYDLREDNALRGVVGAVQAFLEF